MKFLKINKLKINSYGKLKEKEINLENGINLIYGENEAGKSTLLILFMEFLKIKKEKNFQIMKNINHGLEKNFREKLIMN